MKAVHQEGMTAVDMCQMLGFLVKQTLACVKGPIGLDTVIMGGFQYLILISREDMDAKIQQRKLRAKLHHCQMG